MTELIPRPVGRPSEYRPEYCDTAIELGKTGASKVEIAVEIGVDRKTLDRWMEAHPEFRHALTRALDLSQVWWERKGRDNLEADRFQASMWSRSMAARFPDDWREKQDVDLNAKVQVSEIKRTIVDPRNPDA